eukprot:gene4427-biopygen896
MWCDNDSGPTLPALLLLEGNRLRACAHVPHTSQFEQGNHMWRPRAACGAAAPFAFGDAGRLAPARRGGRGKRRQCGRELVGGAAPEVAQRLLQVVGDDRDGLLRGGAAGRGVVRCGAVWCDVASCGRAQCGAVRRGCRAGAGACAAVRVLVRRCGCGPLPTAHSWRALPPPPPSARAGSALIRAAGMGCRGRRSRGWWVAGTRFLRDAKNAFPWRALSFFIRRRDALTLMSALRSS